MTRQEIEKAIENGESVWLISYKAKIVVGVKRIVAFEDDYCFVDSYYPLNEKIFYDNIFKTKDEAEHFLHHANITRTETLPFFSWEEFKDGKKVIFKAKNGHEFLLKHKQESIYLWWLDTNNIILKLDLTEFNFYKAYDECVKLFFGRKN